MSKIYPNKMSVVMQGEFVVFLIGMRINKLWKVNKWWPVFRAMPRMLKELYTQPELGFLGHHFLGPITLVQYWRSFEHLEAYARSKDYEHLPAWVNFVEKVRHGTGDVGIWHETYRIAPGEYEAVYSGMPAFGLGKVGKLVAASGHRESARGRMH